MTSISPGKIPPGNSGDRPAAAWAERDFEAVLVAARSGEGWAFQRLYEWLAPHLTAFAAARRNDDPEGITNEAFLRAFHRIDAFEGSSTSFRSWMFAITRNLVIDAHRAASRRPQSAGNEIPELAVAGAETEALDALALERVTQLLDTLSVDQRDVILLRMVGDLSLKQVAVVVDKPVSAVKALQRRGLRRLQSEVLAEVMTP